MTRWKSSGDQQMQLFNRQAVPMVWDFPEANILEPKAISWLSAIDMTIASIEIVLTEISKPQNANQFNAAKYEFTKKNYLISTDPPYYDNIGYSDLSDFLCLVKEGSPNSISGIIKYSFSPKNGGVGSF